MPNGLLKITDFRMAGFLVVKGSPFLRTEYNGKQVIFVFDDGDGKSSNILNTYPNSAEQKYDSACKTMHDMVRITLANNKK